MDIELALFSILFVTCWSLTLSFWQPLTGNDNLNEMSEQKELVAYYQEKIDELYRQRLAWLSRFDECASQLTEKQELMDSLKGHRDKEGELRRHIAHHDIALLDEQINVNKMQRECIFNEYQDAQQILKIEELMEQFPEEAERHLPCALLSNNAETIHNELNIHSHTHKAKHPKGPTIFREQNSVLSQGQQRQKGSKLKYKPTYEELMRRQIAELKANQDKEAVLLQEQANKLQRAIGQARRQEVAQLEGQREAVADLKRQQQRQEQRHKEVAQKYFDTRRQIKAEREVTLAEQQRLKETLKKLEARVSEELRIYEKENKARQTLILRKSEDFEEDYKARMRAKEHNLQALRDNYQKMQQVCIEKVQKLQAALAGARRKLEQTQQHRQQTVAQLRAELNELERRQKEQRVERARIDQQAREKVEAEKRKREELKERAAKEEKKYKQAQLIEEAYRKGAPKAKPKPKPKTPKQEQADSASGSEQEDSSMDLSQLQNIKQHINKLQNIIQPKKQK